MRFGSFPSTFYAPLVQEDEPTPTRTARFAAWLHLALLRLAERMTVYTVSLPRRAEIAWPELCMVCGARAPETIWFEWVSRIGMWSIVAGAEPPWRRRGLEVPICGPCFRRWRRRTWVRRIVPFLVLLSILLGGLVLAAWIRTFSPTVGRVVQVTAVLLAILTAVTVGATIGWPIRVNVRNDELHFDFSSRELAEALAEANGTVVKEPTPIESE